MAATPQDADLIGNSLLAGLGSTLALVCRTTAEILTLMVMLDK